MLKTKNMPNSLNLPLPTVHNSVIEDSILASLFLARIGVASGAGGFGEVGLIVLAASGEGTLLVIYSSSLIILPDIGSGTSSNLTSMGIASGEIGLFIPTTSGEAGLFNILPNSGMSSKVASRPSSNITLLVLTSREGTLFVTYSSILMILPEFGSGMS